MNIIVACVDDGIRFDEMDLESNLCSNCVCCCRASLGFELGLVFLGRISLRSR